MLRADRDLEQFSCQVDPWAALQVEIVGGLVEPLQPLDRRRVRGHIGHPGAPQVVLGFGAESADVEVAAARVGAEVEPDPASAQHRLAVDQQVDQGRPVGRLAGVERPLVALQEDQRRLHGEVADRLGQELALAATVGVGADEPRHHLQVAARDVPAGGDRRQSELPLGQVLAGSPGAQRGAGRTPLAVRVDRIRVDARRAAGRVDHVGRPDQQEAGAGLGRGLLGGLRGLVHHQQADDSGLAGRAVDHQVDDPAALHDRHPGRSDAVLQAFGHRFGRVGPDRGGSLARVVVGLVADELAVAIGGERHAYLDQVRKGAGRIGGLGERVVAVHRAAGEQRGGQVGDRVGGVAAEAQLVVGLLVGAGIAGRARPDLVGDHDQVGVPGRHQSVGGAIAGRTGADHDGGGDDGGNLVVLDQGV